MSGSIAGIPDRRASRVSWHVQYRQEPADCVARFQSPEEAIEAACRLMDDGNDVFGIGTGPLSDTIDRGQVARIYAMWVRARTPLG